MGELVSSEDVRTRRTERNTSELYIACCRALFLFFFKQGQTPFILRLVHQTGPVRLTSPKNVDRSGVAVETAWTVFRAQSGSSVGRPAGERVLK